MTNTEKLWNWKIPSGDNLSFPQLYVGAVNLTARLNGVNFLLALTLAAAIFSEVNRSDSGETYFCKILALARSVNFFQKIYY